MKSERRVLLAGYLAVCLIAAALLLAPQLAGHVDDLDAQLHRTVVKHMVQSGHWLDLSCAPGLFPTYREHLPFAFMPFALGLQLLGPWGLDLVGLIFSLGTITIVMLCGYQLSSPGAALIAALTLTLTESFWHWGARVLPDPLLWFFATGAAVLVLPKELSRRRWLLAGLMASLGALVKGPFGLAPLACAATAAAIVDRAPRKLVLGALVTLGALLPLTAFLVADHLWLHLGWWEGYGRNQLLASAIGLRADGSGGGFFLPFLVTLTRFWPGLPLVAVALWHAAKPEERFARLLGLLSLLLLGILCLPSRKWPNHTWVAFPFLALLAGEGARRWLGFWPGIRPWAARLSMGLSMAAVLTIAASAAGLGRLVQPPPCVISTSFHEQLNRLPPGSDVLVVAPETEVRLIASILDETTLSPWSARELELSGRDYQAAFIREPASPPLPPGFAEAGRAGGWTLLVRVRA